MVLGILPLAFVCGLMNEASPSPPELIPGISQALAEQRKNQLREVSYALFFQIERGAQQIPGRATIHLTLDDLSRDLVVDFSEQLQRATVNHSHVKLEQAHDHWIIPKQALQKGENTLTFWFDAPLAASGTATTVYRDPVDNHEYVYTLLVPSDGHRLFPCFDQPDLKAPFSLTLEVPESWTAVSNAKLDSETAIGRGRRQFVFSPTAPISTYLFAFAAGPFAELRDDSESVQPLGLSQAPRLYFRESQRGQLEADTLFRMHRDALDHLERYFDSPYPFDKLDAVLVPGFPYGGMEHPGAIFYRESRLVFDHSPTATELLQRSILVYHEVSHQWWGNLVTMHWFDDLWLKEGFATFLSYRLLETVENNSLAWLRFHQSVKPSAYRIDVTPGSVPVYQALLNLDDAKSNYGPIVYNKAPAVLQELEARIGKKAFQKGVQQLLEDFAWGNAGWNDVLQSFEESAQQDLSRWSQSWILSPGAPTVQLQRPSSADGSWTLQQTGPGLSELPWSLRGDAWCGDASSPAVRLTWELEEWSQPLELPPGPHPWVLLNPRDVAYGNFLLDERSANALLEGFPEDWDALTRAVAFTALHATVLEAQLNPARFAEFCLTRLEVEQDPVTYARTLDALSSTLLRLLGPDSKARWIARSESLLHRHVETQAMPGMELELFRHLARFSDSERTLDWCRSLLDSESEGSLSLGRDDQALAVAALFAAGKVQNVKNWFSGSGEDLAKAIFLAKAATPDPTEKASVFRSFLLRDQPPEQWVQEGVSFFHWPSQDERTLPFLERALQQVNWVKEHRKIFFLPAWIDGFVNAHHSPEALAVVEEFLASHPELPQDIRRKILQSVDSLRRVVRIRQRFAGSS